ncbi:MAG: LacI family DNA-binding transcriptional regulator [Bryobacteraceae bacterium]
MSTIKEVAERAGVSIGTASNVIGGAAPVSKARTARVLAAIQELDYHPNEVARSLKAKQTKMLGMVLPDITNPFFSDLIRGAENAALERGYLLLTANSDEQVEREKRFVAALRSRRVDGILLAATASKNETHLKSAIAAGVPIVCLDRVAPGLAVDVVLADNVRGTQECVRHIIRLGHKKIAIITGALELQTAGERLAGYRAALEESGIRYSEDLVMEGDFREEAGYRLGKQLLLRRERPSAIFACNGVMMLGLLVALDELGVRCPEEIALATFDDLRFAHSFHPHLTAVAQPGNSIGYQGTNLLIDRVEGKLTGDPLTIRLAPELKIRESTRGYAAGSSSNGSPSRGSTGTRSTARARQ